MASHAAADAVRFPRTVAARYTWAAGQPGGGSPYMSCGAADELHRSFGGQKRPPQDDKGFVLRLLMLAARSPAEKATA
jgi:hypothetical protein